ncbi:MAG: hypothetical protein M3Q10_01680 [Chloroflexota bacterium]|nr:hypothetical protein [Chloroflexota bacterium]
MGDIGKRLDALEAVYRRADAPRVYIVERAPDGRLSDLVTGQTVEPRPIDRVIVIAERADGRR